MTKNPDHLDEAKLRSAWRTAMELMGRDPDHPAAENEFLRFKEHKEEEARKLRLISRRGRRIDTGGTCVECGRERRYVWRYSQSSQGPVLLCGECKGEVFNRSFGNAEGWWGASSGGGFETNRRRH